MNGMLQYCMNEAFGRNTMVSLLRHGAALLCIVHYEL